MPRHRKNTWLSSIKLKPNRSQPKKKKLLPKELKEQMRDKLNEAAKELYDVDNFADMIADETICTEDPEELLNYLTEVGHPVLSMEPFDM